MQLYELIILFGETGNLLKNEIGYDWDRFTSSIKSSSALILLTISIYTYKTQRCKKVYHTYLL